MHFGLYFSLTNVETARQHALLPPFEPAWALLRQDAPQPDALRKVVMDGFRCRFDGNLPAGEAALTLLLHELHPQPTSGEITLTLLRSHLATAHSFEMLRDHAAARPQLLDGWREGFQASVLALNAATQRLTFLEEVWLNTLNAAAGVLLERDDMLLHAAGFFRQVIDHETHPQGFIQKLVDGRDGGSLERMLAGVQALTLLAEIITQTGTDLWAYNQRGVSLFTAALYPLYYYYYPEKWRWDAEITEEHSQALFRQYGSYLEILNLRQERPTQAVDLILGELRPVFDPYGGGLTTLSHARVPASRRRFLGLF